MLNTDAHAIFLHPGGVQHRTGGTLYNQRLCRALADRGTIITTLGLDGTWPLPQDTEIEAIDRALHTIAPGTPLWVDGLVWTGLGPLLPTLSRRHPCTVIVHSPLFQETGLDPTRRDWLRSTEAEALELAHRRVVTGGPAARDLRDTFGLDAILIEPGVHPAPVAPAADPTALLTVATVTPRKRHTLLVAALAGTVRGRLDCAGAVDRSPETTAAVHALAASLGVADRVRLLGELDEPDLSTLFHRAGLVVQGAAYEAYGMAIAEAVARGLPVVSAPAGVLEGPCQDAALIVQSDEPAAWTAALEAAMGPAHARLRTAALHARTRLPTWAQTAARFAALS